MVAGICLTLLNFQLEHALGEFDFLHDERHPVDIVELMSTSFSISCSSQPCSPLVEFPDEVVLWVCHPGNDWILLWFLLGCLIDKRLNNPQYSSFISNPTVGAVLQSRRSQILSMLFSCLVFPHLGIFSAFSFNCCVFSSGLWAYVEETK